MTRSLRSCTTACSGSSSCRSATPAKLSSSRAAAGPPRAHGYPRAREPGAFLSEEDAIEALIGAGRMEEAEARLEVGGARARDRSTACARHRRSRAGAARGRPGRSRSRDRITRGGPRAPRRLPRPDRAGTDAGGTRQRIQASRAAPDARATLKEALEIFEQMAPGSGSMAPAPSWTARRTGTAVVELTDGTACGRAGRGGTDEQGCGGGVVRIGSDRRVEPHPHLRQAGRSLGTELAARGLPSEDEPAR